MWKSHKRNTCHLFFCVSRCVLWLWVYSKARGDPLLNAVDFKLDSLIWRRKTTKAPVHLNPCGSMLFSGWQHSGAIAIYLSKAEGPWTPLLKYSLSGSEGFSYIVKKSTFWQMLWQLASCSNTKITTKLASCKFSGIPSPCTEQAKGAWLKASLLMHFWHLLHICLEDLMCLLDSSTTRLSFFSSFHWNSS